jgi:hypothetical protein
MRPHIFFVSVLLFLAATAPAQKIDTSFQLLWYKGKKINDTSLITASGTTISFSPSRNDVTVTLEEKSDPLSGLKRAISNPSELAGKLSGMVRGQSDEMNAAIVSHVNAAVTEVIQQFQTVFDNHISLGTIPPVDRSPSQTSKPAAVPLNIKDMYNDVLKYVEKIRADNSFNIPEPPGMYFDYCYPCDVARQAAFKSDSARFIQTFLGEETANIYKAVKVIAYFQNLKSAHLSFDSAASAKICAEMRQSIYSIAFRIYKKLIAVWDRYKSDAHKIYFLVVFLILEKQWHTYIDPQTIFRFPSNAEMAETFVAAVKDILATARKERDYPILFGISGIFKTFTTIVALGVEVKTFDFVVTFFFENNEFDFFIETEAQVNGTAAAMLLAKLHSRSRYFVMPNSECHLEWFLKSPNKSQYIYDLDAIGMTVFNGESLAYAGTTKFKSSPPGLKLDFCDEKRDTAHFYGFEPDGSESWVMRGKPMPGLAAVLPLYAQCFLDIQQFQNVREPSSLRATPYSFFFKEHLVNKQKTVFDHTLDGKRLSPSNQFIKYATYRVKIEHVEEK